MIQVSQSVKILPEGARITETPQRRRMVFIAVRKAVFSHHCNVLIEIDHYYLESPSRDLLDRPNLYKEQSDNSRACLHSQSHKAQQRDCHCDVKSQCAM